MKITASLSMSLLLIPALAVAQPWSAGLSDAVLRSNDQGDLHFQKVNLRSDDHDMIRLVAKTAPAVVMIAVVGPAENDEETNPENQSFEDSLKDFLKKHSPDGQVQPEADAEAPKPAEPKQKMERGFGSGVIITVSGKKLIVTNAHVVKIAGAGAEVGLKYHDGSTGPGKVLGYNEKYDLAFVEPKQICKTCRSMPIADSNQVKRGQIAIAIGSPFSLYQTVTVGHVSFLGRDIQAGGVVADFIQVDAAINPGNSGGALVDRDGRLIGINTAIFSPTGAFAGIGFATPSRHVAHVLGRYLKTGVISPSRIGLQVGRTMVVGEDGKPVIADGKIALTPLQVAADPDASSPAASAGLKKGDEILSVDGRKVETAEAFVKAITDKVPGEKVTIVVRRGDQTLTVASDVVSAHP